MTTETAYQNTKTSNAGGVGHGCVSTREGHEADPLPLVYGNALPVAGVVAVSILMAALLALFTWASFPSSKTGGRGVSAPVGGEVEIDIQGGFSIMPPDYFDDAEFNAMLDEIFKDFKFADIPCETHREVDCSTCYSKAKACVICGHRMRNDADGNVHWRCYRDYRESICA